MEFFRIHKTIPFMRYSHILNAVSIVSFLFAVYWIFMHGLAFSIEFTGGTQVVVNYPEAVSAEDVRNTIQEGLGVDAAVQNYGTARDLMIRLPMKEGESSGQQAQELLKVLSAKVPDVKILNNEFVGPQVGEELATDGATALMLVVLGIIIYLSLRFEWKFAVAAIIANMHDIIIVVGIFAIMQWEFSLPVLAALGYSVNESVIIFDRVREHFRKMRRTDTMEVINSAITATISRTIITHTSTLAMTLSMFFFGGPALHHFSLALTIGICLSIYSSVFVAAAIAMYLGVKREDLVKPVKKDDVQAMVP